MCKDNGKYTFFKNWCWNNWTYVKKNESGTIARHTKNYSGTITRHTKNYSKQVRDLNAKHKTIKFIEENIRENLHGLVLGNDFLNMML